MDRRTIIAFVLMGVLTYIWVSRQQNHAQEKQKKLQEQQASQSVPTTETPKTNPSNANADISPPEPYSPESIAPVRKEDLVVFGDSDSSKYKTVWTPRGAGLQEACLTEYAQKLNDDLRLLLIEATNQKPPTLAMVDIVATPGYRRLPLEKEDYEVKRHYDGTITFSHTFPNGLFVGKEIRRGENDYELHLKVTLKNTNTDKELPTAYQIYATSRVPPESGSALQLQGVIGYQKAQGSVVIERKPPGKLQKTKSYTVASKPGELQVLWTGAENRYFAAVLRPVAPKGGDVSDFIYEAFVELLPQSDNVARSAGGRRTTDNVATSLRTHARQLAPGKEISDEYVFFFGPKKKEVLADYSNMKTLLSYGVFGFVSKALLAVLHFFYSIIPNYGIGIILVTVLVKIALHPLTRKGQVAMHRMQKLQPLIREMQEKYKNDRQRLAKEQMELFKKHGANPMSGCMPLFLQLPLFWGLFQMLQYSVDLRHQGFVLWIKDLSAPDTIGKISTFPINILPVLMVISWVAQQLMMPKSPDPKQAQQRKIMMLMPIIFGFMLYGTASGLTLYWLTSTFLGIIEQKLIKLEIHKMETRGAFAPAETDLPQNKQYRRKRK